MKRIAILGSTGSIGTRTLDVVRQFPEKFRVTALAAGRSTERLAAQVREFAPALVAVADETTARELAERLPLPRPRIAVGPAGIEEVATHAEAELVVSALVGMVGLVPTLAAIRAGKAVALANKEPLVMAGPLVLDLARERGVPLLPIDSEHSAVFQCLEGRTRDAVRRLILTASGGPFLDRTERDLMLVTPEEAIQHPRWAMGRKISVDSATMMNKGLEVIEAHWLFDLPPERISVVIHPESIVHALVELCDGQVLAQMAHPDMRGPIAYALSYPDRLPDVVAHLDLAALGRLTFREVDEDRFPALGLAYRSITAGGTAPALLSAANEVLVEAFLHRVIAFTDIIEGIRRVLDVVPTEAVRSLDDVMEADRQARAAARAFVRGRAEGRKGT